MPKAIQPDFKSIFETAPGLNLILLPNLTIIAVSDAYLQATMTKRTGIIGHHLFEIFPDNPADSSATGVFNLRFSLNYVLEHKVAHTMAVQKYDIRKPDGTFEERYWSPINKPVLDSNNAVEFIIHRVEDITEFILMKKEQAEKEGYVAVLQLQVEEMEIETYKRAQEIQQLNQKLLVEIEQKNKSEENFIEINNILELKVLERTSEILKSKKTLAETLERITDAFVALDKNWCYTYVNSKAEQIFNRAPGYLIGKHIWTEFPEGIDQSFFKAYHRAMEEQWYIHVEEYYPPYDKWFENHIYPSPQGLSIFFRDITDKKKAEEILNQNRNFIESIINASPDIIYTYDIEERKNVYVNEGIQLNLGYTNEEIKQMGNQLIPTLMHPEDFNNYLQNTYPKYEALKEKEIIAHEFRMKDKTGNWHWLYCKESIFLRNPDGTPKQIFSVATDITERKKAEENLREADQRLTKHLYNTPLAVIEWDKNFIIQKWSLLAENIFGWKEAEVVNKHFNELNLVFEEDAAACSIIAQELMTGAVDQNKNINRNNTKAGKVIYCQWFNSVLKDEQGNTQSIFSLIQDVTVQKKGAEENKKANERFEMIAGTTYDAIWEWNLVTGELWANEVHQQLFGLTKADPVPTEEEWKERIHPEDRNKTVTAKKMAFASTQDYWESEYRFQKTGGDYIVLFDRSYIIRNSKGKAVRLTGSMFDITERKKAEETVKRSEEKRRLIMNAALDAIICIDTKGKITFWNPQAEQIFGWKAEEVMDCILSELIIPQSYRERHDKGIDRDVRTGYRPRLNELLEFSAIDRIGREFPIELTVLPIKQIDEEFFCAFIRDITGRKNAEQMIRNSEEKYRTLVEQASDAIFIADANGWFIAVNTSACKLSQFSEEELLQMSIYDFAIIEDIQREPFHFDDLKQGKTVISERVMKRKDGFILNVEISAKSLSDGRLLTFLRDISERIKAQEEIKQTSEKLRQLTAHLQNIRDEERKRIGREIHDELGQQLTAIKMDVAWIDKKIPEESMAIKNKLNNITILLDGSNESIRKILNELRHGFFEDNGLLEALEWQGNQFTEITGIPVKFITKETVIELPEQIANCIFRIYQESLTNIMRYAQASKVLASLSIKDDNIILIAEDNGKGFDIKGLQNSKSFGILGMKERVHSLNGKFTLDSVKGKGTKIMISLPYKS